jgi:hypothetical protein
LKKKLLPGFNSQILIKKDKIGKNRDPTLGVRFIHLSARERPRRRRRPDSAVLCSNYGVDTIQERKGERGRFIYLFLLLIIKNRLEIWKEN